MGVDDKQALSTREGLEQGYCVVPSEQRFLLLFTFLKRNLNKKVMVFFSSCASVKYHAEMLNYIDVPVKVSFAICWLQRFCARHTLLALRKDTSTIKKLLLSLS